MTSSTQHSEAFSKIRTDLVTLRESGGLSITDLGQILGVNRMSIHGWLGKREPKPYRLCELERRIKVLQELVKSGQLPLPLEVKQSERKVAIGKLIYAHLRNTRVS